MAKHLVEYVPPSWARKLKNIPKYRVELAVGTTPVHEWNIPCVPEGFKVGIKRQDMTGSTLTGNKVEKLEFLLADAIATGCKHVMACGSPISNLCRTTALACRQVGLIPHLFLMSDVKDASEVGCRGNILFNRLAGATMYLIPKPRDEVKEVYPKMEALVQKILKEKGEKSYFIPKGASNTVGLFGSMAIFDQLSKQGALDQYDDVVLPCGSSGTTAGLCIANYLAGSPLRVHGVLINYNEAYVHRHVNHELHNLGIDDVRSEDILDIIGDYLGGGYAATTQEEFDYIVAVSTTTGVVLDPTYTGRAAWGMIQELKRNPGRFKGRRILFIHTGGMFGLFEGCMDDMLKKPGASTNNITIWSEEFINGTQCLGRLFEGCMDDMLKKPGSITNNITIWSEEFVTLKYSLV